MAFGEVATAGDLEDFRGFYTCDGLTNQPMKFLSAIYILMVSMS
ncbi:hypothetical protein ACGO3R_13725 [Lactococcus lactis]